MFFVFRSTIFEKKYRGYNRATVSSITRKILVCDMESWYKNISKIRYVTFIFKLSKKKKIKNVKKIKKFK